MVIPMIARHLFAPIVLCVAAGAAAALIPPSETIRLIEAAFEFGDMDDIAVLPDIVEMCGGGVSAGAVFCTSENRIFLDSATAESEGSLYLIAHLSAHALQVHHGIADVALAAIRAEPEREAELRGMVERQNDCLAGMLLARAGLSLPDLVTLYDDDPLEGAHWGRNPVRNGPRLHVPLGDRAEWLAIGYAAAAPDVCDVGDMSADLIVAADPRAAD